MPLGRLAALVFLVAGAVGASVCGGCAFGDRQVRYGYAPVVHAKAARPQAVAVGPLASGRDVKDERQIGQVRNAYGMVTAKVLTADGDAADWVRRALVAELSDAGYVVTERSDGSAAAGRGVSVNGAVKEFHTDMYVSFKTRLRVQLMVTRGDTTALDKEYVVEEGGAGITASADEYQDLTNAAMKKLMRRAVPEIVAAIDR